MQIMSSAIKSLVFAACASLAGAAPAQTVDEQRLSAYRADYKDAATPVKYVFVHADGSPCCADGDRAKAYLLDITSAVPAKLIYSAEIDRLFKEKFEIEVDNESIVNGPQGDYVVLTMNRPAEYDRKFVPCAGGMGESRAYLISIVAGKATVIDREFGGCGRQYKKLDSGDGTGYEVQGGNGQAKPVRYLVHGNTIARDKAVH